MLYSPQVFRLLTLRPTEADARCPCPRATRRETSTVSLSRPRAGLFTCPSVASASLGNKRTTERPGLPASLKICVEKKKKTSAFSLSRHFLSRAAIKINPPRIIQ